MHDLVRVAVLGTGQMGSGIARLLLQKPGVALVGAWARRRERSGMDLGTAIGLERELGVAVCGDLEELAGRKPHIAIQATCSRLSEASEEIAVLVRHGIPVISIAEEMAYPAAASPALAGELHRLLQARLVLLGGHEDHPVAAQVQEHLPFPVLDLTGKTKLRQALAVLRRLDLLVTNDSGLMHAAAALGVPLVAIFGSTDPAATGPFTSQASVLHHPLPCSPCFLRTCPEDYPCLTAITVDQVMAAARGWLEETP